MGHPEVLRPSAHDRGGGQAGLCRIGIVSADAVCQTLQVELHRYTLALMENRLSFVARY